MKLDELCHPDAHQLTMTTKQMAGKSKMMMKKKMKKKQWKVYKFYRAFHCFIDVCIKHSAI